MAGRPRIADSVLDLDRQHAARPPEPAPARRAARRSWPRSSRRIRAGASRTGSRARMIEDAERRGALRPGSTLVEPTSGNTGIGLAMVAAVKGYRLILTMPDDMSLERRRLLARLGAELVLTPAIEGMTGAVYAAQELCRTQPRLRDAAAVREPGQPGRPPPDDGARDPRGHGRASSTRSWPAWGRAARSRAWARCCGSACPGVRIVAVEPARSPVLSGGKSRVHGIQGIGASFVPGILNRAVIDEVVQVKDEDAMATALRLAREEGLLVGHLGRRQRVGGARGGRAARRRPDGRDGPLRHRRAVPERPARSRGALREAEGGGAMAVSVYIPTPFRRATANEPRVDVDAGDVKELLDTLEERFEGLRGLVRDDGGPGAPPRQRLRERRGDRRAPGPGDPAEGRRRGVDHPGAGGRRVSPLLTTGRARGDPAARARPTIPAECCGVVLVRTRGRRGSGDSSRAATSRTSSTRKDPGRFPRTARTAYYIAHEDLLEIGRREAEGFEVHVIYHSHVDTGAYFSETDRRNAMIDGTPAYPAATYVVVGGHRGPRRGDARASLRARRPREFVEVPLSSREPRSGQKAVDGSGTRCYHPPAFVKERTCLLGPP